MLELIFGNNFFTYERNRLSWDLRWSNLSAITSIAQFLIHADYLFTNSLKESLKLYGKEDKVTVNWGIVATITQISFIGISIYVFLT